MVNIFIGLINIFNGNSPRSLCVGLGPVRPWTSLTQRPAAALSDVSVSSRCLLRDGKV
jgi:hypothetical protein